MREIENKGQKITNMKYRDKNREWDRREMVTFIQKIFARKLTWVRISTELDPVVEDGTMPFAVMHL